MKINHWGRSRALLNKRANQIGPNEVMKLLHVCTEQINICRTEDALRNQ